MSCASWRSADLVAADGFLHLAASDLHALRSGGYDVAHRDPFDRPLAAQSELEALTLVTGDPALAQFGVRTLW
jgi:PIN domain nuclease of toxin-antitoxin system